MKLIGLAGPLRVGKDTIADYLVEKHEFLKFSFSDSLYAEVASAFAVHPSVLYAADTKETPLDILALNACDDDAFVVVARPLVSVRAPRFPKHAPNSPRQILQWWGTEYRRAQDPDYWVKRSDEFVVSYLNAVKNNAPVPLGGLVNTSVRFQNECEYVRAKDGEVWHIYRRASDSLDRTYVSEKRLPVAEQDRQLFNNATIEQLRSAVSIMLSTDSRLIALEGPNVPLNREIHRG